MAQRAKAKKTDKSAASAAKPKGKSSAAGSSSRGNRTKSAATSGRAGGDLEAECARLRRELAAAKAEIAQLQKRQELVVNRIDWVIDSLHNLLEDET